MTAPNRRYAVPINNDLMAPRCKSGQIVIVDPDETVQVDQEVLLLVGDPDPGATAFEAHFGRLVRRGTDRVEIAVLNPPQVVAFEAEEVAAVHRVIAVYTPAIML